MPTTLAAAAALLMTTVGVAAQTPQWQTYSDPEYGYRIDIPTDLLEPEDGQDGRLVFRDPAGPVQLSVYAEENHDRLPLSEVAASLERSEWIREITYRRSGASWLVISGYYDLESGRGADLVFYLKLMMSPDRSRYAVFAISYPEAEKPRYDPVVERLEDSFRPPS
ncbi:MAG: photosystem II reaction center PsbP family protein [Rhizobiaceae bacterium]|nr:photosystem II reaction center PsbP family protein [Rhizobiaceae bacterium]MCV0408093.1 photosystem II reaction center PsbP family protein [Rhizobiaceae bacterium]